MLPSTVEETPLAGLIANKEVKMAVVGAVGRLMRHIPIDCISVARICKEAEISRSTFYRHFQDKYDVAQWLHRYIMAQGANEIGRTLTFHEGYLRSEALILEHLEFITNASKSHDHNALLQFAPRLRRAAFENTITRFYGLDYTDHLKHLVYATVEVEVGLFPKWHETEMRRDLSEYCRWIAECVPDELVKLLGVPLYPGDEPAGPFPPER